MANVLLLVFKMKTVEQVTPLICMPAHDLGCRLFQKSSWLGCSADIFEANQQVISTGDDRLE